MSKRNAAISFPGKLFDEELETWVDGVPHRCDLPPGSASWVKWYSRDEIAGLMFVCPCGCGSIGYVNTSGTTKPVWQWDGNSERPTLTPSIQRTTGCKWHGYLRNGVFEEC